MRLYRTAHGSKSDRTGTVMTSVVPGLLLHSDAPFDLAHQTLDQLQPRAAGALGRQAPAIIPECHAGHLGFSPLDPHSDHPAPVAEGILQPVGDELALTTPATSSSLAMLHPLHGAHIRPDGWPLSLKPLIIYRRKIRRRCAHQRRCCLAN